MLVILRRVAFAVALGFGVSACGTPPVVAQQLPRLDLGVAAGPSPYDLSGTGTGFAAGIRAPWQASRWLVIEPGIGFLSYNSQFDTRTSYLFPELSIQGQLRVGRVRPFLGGGAGGALVLQGEGETQATLHAVSGLRLDLDGDWTASGELRVRAVRPWSGNTADILLGISRRLR